MTDVDEHLLTAAKLAEQARGNVDTDLDLHEYLGHVDGEDLGAIAFAEQALDAPFGETAIGREVLPTLTSKRANRALEEGNGEVLSHLVGVTEQELNADQLTVASRLMDLLDNDGVLTTVLAAGAPNSGKSNTMFLLGGDLARAVFDDDLLVISNSGSWDGADRHVTSMYELMQLLVEERDVPKTFILDEASRYMDARVYNYEVSTQWAPAQKAMSKLGVEVAGCIGHTGKDVAPPVKRLTNLAFWKDAPETVTFYEEWQGDADRPSTPIFDADLVDLEPTLEDYDPDDVASWSWDLDPAVWDGFDDWDQFDDSLQEVGPATQ